MEYSFVFLCCRYNGLMNNTNMVIVDIGMLSGFVPMQSSLKTVGHHSALLTICTLRFYSGVRQFNRMHICISQLKTSISIDRVDVEDDHVIIYVAEVLFFTLSADGFDDGLRSSINAQMLGGAGGTECCVFKDARTTIQKQHSAAILTLCY